MTEKFTDYISPEPNSGCWLWTGTVNRQGYGRWGKKSRYAHRLVYETRHGAIPPGLCALHKCDNPCCVNPDHIFLGSRADNTRDMYAKGRDRTTGDRSASAKLSSSDVATIRASNESLRTLGLRYGVGHSTIGKIKRGERWRNVGR